MTKSAQPQPLVFLLPRLLGLTPTPRDSHD